MNEPMHEIRVWDLPTRLFHWTLLVLIVLQFGSGQFHWLSMQWHFRFGYAILALVLFRILWGVFGSQTSRFADFVRGPRAVLRYLRDSIAGSALPMPGHNPLGGWSVLAMLASIAVQALSGLFTSDDISEEGPLVARVSGATVKWMSRIHHLNRYVLVLLIVLHIGAIVTYRVLRRQDLVRPMLVGRGRFAAARELRFVSVGLALLLLAASAAAVWALVAWGEAG